MVQFTLVLAAIVVPILLLFLNVVILSKYVDPQHAGGHWCAKAIVLFGLLLAECGILLLPLDVGNRAGVVGCGFWNDNCGGLDLELAWNILYVAIAIMVVLVLPFAIFYYESDDEAMGADASGRGAVGKALYCGNCRRSCCSATIYTTITVVIAVATLMATWLLLGKTHIPVEVTTVDTRTVAFFNATQVVLPASACGTGDCKFTEEVLKMDVSFVIYLAGLMSFVGWFLFTIYVGIGLVGLPLDMFNAFRHRPKVLSKIETINARNMLRRKAEELVSIGERLGDRMIAAQDNKKSMSRSEKRKAASAQKKELKQYKVLVEALEAELEEFELCNPENFREHRNPLIPWFKLFLGFFYSIVTLLWIVHIVVYMLVEPPASTFLNKYLIWFDEWFPLFGTISIAFLSMYLLLAAMKGNFKFGVRFFLITIHPMEMGKTLMNSFLFNIALILLCVLPVVQFSTDAFDGYARLTDADIIFGSTIQHLEFFRYFWENNAFIYAILAITFLSFVFFLCWPSDKDHLQTVFDQIKSKKQQERRVVDTKIKSRGGAISGTELTEWSSGGRRSRK